LPFVDKISIVKDDPAFIRIDLFSSFFTDESLNVKSEDWDDMRAWIDTYGNGSWYKQYSLFITVEDWTFFKLKFGL